MKKDRAAQITAAERADFPMLISLWKESVKATHSFLRSADLADLEQELGYVFLPAMPEIWLCRRQGQIAGFCANSGAHLEMLFVRREYMRQGIGR